MPVDTLSFRWVPPHVNIAGNEQADTLAEQGRLQHPDNEFHDPKRRCGLQGRGLWLLLGREDMQLGSESARSSKPDPDTATASDQVHPRHVTSQGRPLTTPQQ